MTGRGVEITDEGGNADRMVFTQNECADWLRNFAEKLDFEELTKAEALKGLDKAQSLSVQGARVYDYGHALVSQKAKSDELLTRNTRHFEGLARVRRGLYGVFHRPSLLAPALTMARIASVNGEESGINFLVAIDIPLGKREIEAVMKQQRRAAQKKLDYPQTTAGSRLAAKARKMANKHTREERRAHINAALAMIYAGAKEAALPRR